MEPTNQIVERHYGRGSILAIILQAMQQQGKEMNHLAPDDLAPVDEFHARGREGTVELANRITWQPGLKLLDVGCGIGGTSRFLAHTFGAQVSGIDLTHEFIETAVSLTRMVGLDGSIRFVQGSALDLPFADNSFDLTWTEHVQMNIEDKRQLYAEMVRVLKPGGRLLFHDIFRTTDKPPVYPLPWADDPTYSFLTTAQHVREILGSLGMKILQWEDTTPKALVWFEERSAIARQATGPMLSPLLMMGEGAKQKMENVNSALADSTLCTIQAVAEKLSR